jgi:hypothetical protein
MIAIVVCFILLCIVVWIHYVTEPFTDASSAKSVTPSLDQSLIDNYHVYVTTFYNPFMTNWKKAIISSASSEITQQPLTDPSQTSSATPPIPKDTELNSYIMNMSQQMGKPFPPVTETLPDAIDLGSYPSIAPKIPMDPAPYINALIWMNQKLEESHAELESALKGESFTNLEGFSNQQCQDLSTCFQENPELIQQLSAALALQQQQQQMQLAGKLKKFASNSELKQKMAMNAQLFAKSQQIQNQAQSGELMNQLQLPEEPTIKYTLPEGADALDQLKKNDPARYQSAKNTAPSMFSLKTMFDQINRNLR